MSLEYSRTWQDFQGRPTVDLYDVSLDGYHFRGYPYLRRGGMLGTRPASLEAVCFLMNTISALALAGGEYSSPACLATTGRLTINIW